MKTKVFLILIFFTSVLYAQVDLEAEMGPDFSEPSTFRWYQSYILLFAFIPLFAFLAYFIFQYRKKNKEMEQEQERLKGNKK